MKSGLSLSNAAILAVTTVLLVVCGWELYLRQKGATLSYDDGAELWSDKRALADKPGRHRTVFIGSSRIKYDIDLATWQRITGNEPVQLAIEGNSPLMVLEDLGNDPDFKGQLIVDVTEEFFFSPAPYFNTEPKTNIDYYHKETYAQKAGFQLNRILESQFYSLNKKFLSLNAELDNLHIPDRKGAMGDLHFPMEFWQVDFNRQDEMTPQFVADTALHNQVTSQWSLVIGRLKGAPKIGPDPVPAIIQRTLTAVNKIKARGGRVLFVRMPSSGPFYEAERELFKKDKFWMPLVTAAHCNAVYFADYPSLNHFICPEWSHLTPADARLFTAEFIKVIPQGFFN